ncbi:unnamed protein product [Nezara viridula]|uniref:Integrase catalytic domain-containing protein n=1 Tax=Nezara viridula TaxID=85310 RepID=A0A9P0MNP0_NEZVI|nr:unnamed protein product [Nezara viridula]
MDGVIKDARSFCKFGTADRLYDIEMNSGLCLSSRHTEEKQKWKRNNETGRSGLPSIVRSILNRKWTGNIFNKYFRLRRKIKTNINNSKTSISKSEIEDELEPITINKVCADLSDPGSSGINEAWRSIFVDLTKKGSMTYLIFVDQETLHPEVFELGVRSLWKQTKRAFRDVFREYRIPVEIHTSEKVFFSNGKFARFMKDHGIVTAIKSDAEISLVNVLAAVKVIIHNARFWHEELRKLRESISKSFLSTKDECVQVEVACEEDTKLSMSDLSSEGSSKARNDDFDSVIGTCQNYLEEISIDKERSRIKSMLLNKQKQINDRKDVNPEMVRHNEEEVDWMHYLKSFRMKTSKVNKISTAGVDISKCQPFEISFTRNVTSVHHCEIDQSLVKIPGIWKRTKSKLLKKINYYCHNQDDGSTFHENYDEMLNYLSRSSRAEIIINDENNETVDFSRNNEIVLKLCKQDSGDNCSDSGSIPNSTGVQGCGLTSLDDILIRFPIEILPYKYDNLYITQNDLNWKAVVLDVFEHSEKSYYLFIDCATNFPELFLQIENNGSANVKYLINALCRLWQIHGKPIEIHSPKGNLFSCPKLKTLYPEIKEIEQASKLHSARLLIRNFRNFFNEKSTSEEIHVADKWPFNIKGVIGFMEHIGVNYCRQSRYFNGGSCFYKCLEHMKSVICHSADLKSAVYICKKKLLPWLGLSPQQMAHGMRMNPLFNCIIPPWAEIIIDIFSHEQKCYLIVFDYTSLYPECFQMRRHFIPNLSVIKACERSFSVLGCPSKLWTFDRTFTKSDSFKKFLRIRGIQQFFLTPQKERETSSMLASFRQKLKISGSLDSALVSTRGAYNRFIGACPVRKLREKETAVSEALQAAMHQRRHVRFHLSQSSFNDLFSSDSDENY